MFRKLFSFGRSGEEAADNNQYDIDVDSNFCPKCGDEYRAEIATCPTCSIRLIPGSEKLAILSQQETGSPSHFIEISADDELVTLQTGKLGSLKPLQQLLKAEYVPSILAGDNDSKG